jgi:alpha-L-glutamate ligase-like protein
MFRIFRDAFRGQGFAGELLGVNARNRRMILPLNPRRHFPMADDKLKTKERMLEAGVPVPETYEIFSSMIDARHAASRLSQYEDFVLKPSQGGGGSGIHVFVAREENGWRDASGRLHTPEQINRHIADIIFGNFAHGLSDRAMAEERIEQAELFGEGLFPGLPDLRVITHHARPVMAMLRIPTKSSGGRANLHQGAIGIGLDLSSGKTLHASFEGKSISLHPDTHANLVDRQVESWRDIMQVALRAAKSLPLGYLGLDLCLDAHRGPLVIEANVRPGLEIQNANLLGLKRAIGEATSRELKS